MPMRLIVWLACRSSCVVTLAYRHPIIASLRAPSSRRAKGGPLCFLIFIRGDSYNIIFLYYYKVFCGGISGRAAPTTILFFLIDPKGGPLATAGSQEGTLKDNSLVGSSVQHQDSGLTFQENNMVHCQEYLYEVLWGP